MNDGQTAAVDGDAGRDCEPRGQGGRMDAELATRAGEFEAGDGAQVFHDTGEHRMNLTIAELPAEVDLGRFHAGNQKSRPRDSEASRHSDRPLARQRETCRESLGAKR